MIKVDNSHLHQVCHLQWVERKKHRDHTPLHVHLRYYYHRNLLEEGHHKKMRKKEQAKEEHIHPVLHKHPLVVDRMMMVHHAQQVNVI